MSEFNLIQRYFTRPTPNALLGVGDDAALFQPSAGNVLAVSTDMLVSGTHFFPNAEPYALGHKTLAVNLSDMAAMGAVPRWATLALSLPAADENWLQQFSTGFFALAEQYGVSLIGGDTTRGPLNLSVTILGEVPAQQALRRDGAQVGDDIWVSGTLGDAALALADMLGQLTLTEAEFSHCSLALHQPQPRVALGLALRNIAHSAIDISDGLLADLGHILHASKVGARLYQAALPCSEVLRGYPDSALNCMLAGGDDYELCFTAPTQQRQHITNLAAQLNLPLSRIGHITETKGCEVLDEHNQPVTLNIKGYDHFR